MTSTKGMEQTSGQKLKESKLYEVLASTSSVNKKQ